MSRKRTAARAASVPPPDMFAEDRSAGSGYDGRGPQLPATYPSATVNRKLSTRTTCSAAARGNAFEHEAGYQRRPNSVVVGALQRTVLPSPQDFFIFHGTWAVLAAFWFVGIQTGQASGVVGDPAFATTALAVGYHFTLHLLCNYREWTELRKMWCYAASLGLAQIWTQHIQSRLDKPFVIPPATVSQSILTAPIVEILPLGLLLWNIISPFVSIYVGFLSRKVFRSTCLSYVGAAVTSALLILGALNLSPLVLRGALGEFRSVRYIQVPEPTFVYDLDWDIFLVFPKPPYFDHVPAYVVLPSLAYGALAFEGYKVIKGLHKGSFGALSVSLIVAMAHLGISVSSYAAIEGFGGNPAT